MTSAAPTLSIGAAAAQAGMHPQTLREYERQGLLTPYRTPGGTRRYGAHEISRAIRIQRLTAEGLSLAAVHYVLQLEDEVQLLRTRLAELERQAPGVTHSLDASASRPTQTSLLARSMSVEVVHIPRQPRSPRWRNQE